MQSMEPARRYPQAAGRDKSLRKYAGAYIKSLREQRGLTLADVARLVDAAWPSWVQQVENGKAAVPADKYELWANALGVKPQPFVKTLFRYYDPYTYKILFPSERLPDQDDDTPADREGPLQ